MMAKKKYRVVFNQAWCKECGICKAFCPAHVFARGETGAIEVAEPENCIGCRACENQCPDYCLEIEEVVDNG